MPDPVIPAGMKPHDAKANPTRPDDFDPTKPVMFADGTIGEPHQWYFDGKGNAAIIAYHPLPKPDAVEVTAGEVLDEIVPLSISSAWHVGERRSILKAMTVFRASALPAEPTCKQITAKQVRDWAATNSEYYFSMGALRHFGFIYEPPKPDPVDAFYEAHPEARDLPARDQLAAYIAAQGRDQTDAK